MTEEMITGEIRSLAFGGQGILRHEGCVVFVPFTAPGDQVRVKITRRKKSFAEGELLEVLAPGPSRQPAPCQYFGTCGGCQFQHIQYREQLEQKRLFVVDTLQRIGKMSVLPEIKIVPATEQWSYRRHVRLTLRANGMGYEAGYVRQDLSGVLPVTKCPIFLQDLDPLLSMIQQLVNQIVPVAQEGAHLSVIKALADQFVFVFQFPAEVPTNIESVVRQWLSEQRRVVGAVIQGYSTNITVGTVTGSFEVDHLSIRFSPLAFVQCHPEQSRNIYQEVVRLCQLCKANSILDLYCGIGVSSLLLARAGAIVTGVEGNAEAVLMAKDNAQLNGIKNVQFLTADVSRVLSGLMKSLKPDLVLVNPPRTGLDPRAREQLLQGAVPFVLYISCMPATLARDLAAFQERGYVVRSCQAYDMFPQTTHVETIALLERMPSHHDSRNGNND